MVVVPGESGDTDGQGDGGDGVASTITGSSVTRAGGGGAGYSITRGGRWGNAGLGGGGRGGQDEVSNGSNGTANTGGGGGGGTSYDGVGASGGGSGGSGIVILRYPNTKTITLAGGASSSAGEQTDGSDKYIEIQTSGTVSWS